MIRDFILKICDIQVTNNLFFGDPKDIVDTVKDVALDIIPKIPDLLTSIAGMGTIGWIGGGILGLFGIGGAIFIYFAIRNFFRKLAHEKTLKQREQDASDIVDENTDVSKDSRKAEDEIRDITKNLRN